MLSLPATARTACACLLVAGVLAIPFGLIPACVPDAHAMDFWVARDGNDTTGIGSENKPWRTLDYALNVGVPVEGGNVIRVRPGLYDDSIIVYRAFDEEVVVRSDTPHHAVMTNLEGSSTILAVYVIGDANLAFEGFVFTGEGSTGPICTTRSGHMVHFENASNLRFENNIVFGNNREPYCNDLLKINRSAPPHYPRNIRIKGNVFYNSPQIFGNDLIDSVRPGELEICDNIFFNDLGLNESQNFITLKREVTGNEIPPDVQSPRYKVNRNIFLNWEGHPGQAMLNLGEDGVSTYEISDALVENNLFIGNASNPMDAPFQFKGVRGVTVRSNTIVGDLPSTAFGFLVGTVVDNPIVEDIQVYNNLFSDPVGTMGSVFFYTFGDVNIGTVELDNNLFWNDGNALPASGGVLPTSDLNRIEADPLLETDQSAIVLPKWDTTLKQFESGSVTIRQEFERLVFTYGVPAAGSPAIDAADPANSPVDDIMGWVRGVAPDLGAYEVDPPTAVAPSVPRPRSSMSQNMPNPFNPRTTIGFRVARGGHYELKVFDARGQLVRTLMNDPLDAGPHTREWDGTDDNGNPVPSGVYYYRLAGEGQVLNKRMALIR